MYRYALKKEFIKVNFFEYLKAPIHKSEKGIWFNPDEHKLIYNNRQNCEIGNEIEFFIMVGTRLSEAFTCKPDFINSRVWVEREKRDGTSGWVKTSKDYNEYLKANW